MFWLKISRVHYRHIKHSPCGLTAPTPQRPAVRRPGQLRHVPWLLLWALSQTAVSPASTQTDCMTLDL